MIVSSCLSCLKYNLIFLIICISLPFEISSEPKNILKFSCKYDPKLIKKKQKNVDSVKPNEVDRDKICKLFYCEDTVEVSKFTSSEKSDGKYRLRNSWFNHQGILLDEFSMTKDLITINTFVSQAYFLESYEIDRTNGETKRIFYRFDDPDFFYDIQKLEKSSSRKKPLYNKQGKLSLKTLESFSLEPWVIFYFEGKCLEGTGV